MHINPFASTPTPIAPAATANSSPTDSGSDPTSPLQSTDTMFLQLLTTQLKNQSPLDPMDPDQLTSELVQFNMLDQLSQINGFLQSSTIAPPAAGATGSTANATSSIQKQGEN
jgi:flagellar basal-body rod modification protein FlgD